MFKKIIFLTPISFNEHQYRWFGIDYLQEENIQIEVWDVTKFLHEENCAAAFAKEKKPDFPFLYQLHSYAELSEKFEKLSNDCLVVCFFGYQTMYYKILRLLTRHKVPYAYLMNYPMPNLSLARRVQIGGLPYFYSRIKNLLGSLKHRLFLAFPPKLLGMMPPRYILAGGKESLEHPHVLGKKTEIIWLHSFDYEVLFNQVSGDEPFKYKDKKYAVFIDQSLPSHPDTLTGANKAAIKSEDYYPLLDQFFTFLENNFDIEIVIAAHPRSDYTKGEQFKKRSVIKGKTPQLAMNAEFVLMHCSAAVSYVVMFQKPCLFLTTERFKGSHTWHETASLADHLGTQPIRIDSMKSYDKNALMNQLVFDQKQYQQYLEEYIKASQSSNLPFWEGFLQHIRGKTKELLAKREVAA